MSAKLRHLAMIIDGNRRWARERGLPTLEGHRRGYDKVKRVGEWCLARGIEQLTVFAFSVENWNRSAEEVAYLMDLIHRALTKEVDFYMEKNIRLRVIGRREGLSDELKTAIKHAEQKTAGNTAGQVNLCINYGGRAEIVDAVRSLIARDVSADDITEDAISSALWTAGIPDPDLLVRTSGEQRLSGFLTWEGVYSELLFLTKHWPDFSEEDLDAVIAEYEQRERRFGR